MSAGDNEIPTELQQKIDSARGHKAALHNPRVSEERKEHSRQMLERLDPGGAREELYQSDEKPKDPRRVAAGLKAAQNNPLVSQEGRQQAAGKLEDLDEEIPHE
ncbi:hypothetical protein BDW71DRAFT_207833 [Aspergillus fruticulosus]